jgi:pyruvate/2-oxoglutarate dehydrogenase complex dihydrolipoamide acyltransferase (E2) component
MRLAMAISIRMPALSPTMTEGNLARWLVKEGDRIRPGDIIAEIETDKATMEVEAADEGTVGRLVVPAGAQGVKVNDVIATLRAGRARAKRRRDPACGPHGGPGRPRSWRHRGERAPWQDHQG